VGSISKVFTGLLLAQAVERGELSLDDTVGRLLQGQALPDLPPRVAAITLGQLVTHTSCLARLPGDFFRAGYDAANPYQRYDRVRLWASLAQARLVQAPPCQSSYSNWGFGVLGELLSVRYGRPWAELVRERITAPLGMYDTVQELGDKASRLAVPHEGEQVVSSWDFDALAGAGALRSTTADMLLFSRALLAGREGPLGPAAERMFTVLAEHEGAPIGYALMLRDQGGKQTWLHGGGTGGYRAVWLLALDSGEAVIALMSNARALQSDVMAPLLRMRHPAPEGRPAVPGDAIGQHVGDHRIGDQVVVLGRLEHPAFLLVHGLHDGGGADGGQQRRFRLGDEIKHGQRSRRRGRPDQGIHLVFGEQFLHTGHGIGRIGGIVEDDVLDFLAGNLGRQQGDGILLRNADHGGGTG